MEESKENLQPDEQASSTKQPFSVPSSMQLQQTTDVYSPEMMKLYYSHLFPSSLMFHWLSYNNPTTSTYREWSFTLAGDVYIRYCSFATKEELKEQLVKKLPEKIDIGAVFNAPPDKHQSVVNFAPVSKELVFDIDMTDYNDVRKCCSEANVCQHCWYYMTAALRVVDTLLRQDFGFKHLLWIYSGRRGIHCWVCDDRARTLGNDIRTAIVEYLSVYNGSKGNDAQKVHLSMPIHPSLNDAYKLLQPYYEEVIQRQRLFDIKGSHNILNQLDEKAREELAPILLSNNSDEESQGADVHLERWEQFRKKVQQLLQKSNNKATQFKSMNQSLRTANYKAVFSTIYPRLDVNVSKQLNHLLKAPFCVHPKTGRVCIPIDPAHADEFDPINSAPTLATLCEELGHVDATSGTKYWQQTSLAPHIKYFHEFVRGVQADQEEERLRAKKETADHTF